MGQEAVEPSEGADEVHSLTTHRARPDPLQLRSALGQVEAALFGQSSAPLRLQRFTLLHRLGAGGLGVVYAAYDPKLDRKVAIKIVRDDGIREKMSERLLAEAQAIARLTHPNVVTVHDVGSYGADGSSPTDALEGEGVFIVMEYIDGEDLAAYARPSTRTRREVVDRFIDAGRGLAAAHDRGIVHGDFKPQNVMVGVEGRVRVLDFGLARLIGIPRGAGLALDDSDPLRRHALEPSGIAGTPRYMSPEQQAGQSLDARSDQFSYCASVLACLIRRAPFEGATLEELANAKAAASERVLRHPELEPWLARVLARGLEVDPSRRHDSMGQLLSALQRGRERRRRMLVGGGVLALALGGPALALTYAGPQDACAEHENRSIDVWDEARRQTVRGALVSTERPYAEAAARGVTERLDHYVQEWTTARGHACRRALDATEARQAARFEAQASCLDRSLAAADELVSVLVEHPAEVIEHAVDATVALPSLADCRATEARSETSPTGAVADVPASSEAYRELARAQVHFDAANFDRARELATALVERADTEGPSSLRARARLLLGRCEAQLARGPTADEHLFAAQLIAEADDDTELIVLLSIARAEVERRLLGRYPEAARLLQLARVKAERAGLGMTVRRRLEHEQVLLLHVQGRYAEAEAAAEQLVELWTQPGVEDRVGMGDAYMALVEVQYKTRDFVSATENIRRAQRAWSHSYGDAHPARSLGEQRLGDMAWRTGRYDEALKHHRHAHAIELAARGVDHPQSRIRALALANTLMAVGRNDEAEAMIRGAIGRFETLFGREHPTTANARLNLGELLTTMGRLDEAAQTLREVLDYYERSGQTEHPSIPYALLDLGRVETAHGHHEAARGYFDNALTRWRKALGEDHPKLAWVWREMGELHLRRGDRDEAASAFRAGLRVHDASTSDPLHLADLQFGLARALESDDPETATTYARSALATYAGSSYRESEAAAVRLWLEPGR